MLDKIWEKQIKRFEHNKQITSAGLFENVLHLQSAIFLNILKLPEAARQTCAGFSYTYTEIRGAPSKFQRGRGF